MSYRLTKEQLDAQFEQFLKESVSDDSLDFKTPDKHLSTNHSQTAAAPKAAVSWWQDEQHSSGKGGDAETTKPRFLKAKKCQPKEEEEKGQSRCGKSFRKSQSIQEEDEDPGATGSKDEGLDADFLTTGSTDTDYSALPHPAVSVSSLGLDTLEEEEEKARFFAQLEAGASLTIDYSKLNRELDSAGSTVAANLRTIEEAVEQSDDDQSKARPTETGTRSPGSPDYSEDFEDEASTGEPQEEEAETSQILARVSLYDSLDGTGGEDGRKDTAGSMDQGQSYVQSGGSEMEALQEAYQQIQVVGASDQHIQPDSSVEEKEPNNRAVSPCSPPQHTQQSLQPLSTNESELPTAEELMKPIRPEDNKVRGYTLQPISSVDLDHGKTPHLLGRTFTDGTSSEFQQMHSAREVPGCMPPHANAPSRDLTWNIREEVHRLMQDHSKSSHTALHLCKTNKQPASCNSTLSHSNMVSVAPGRGGTAEGRTTEGRTAERRTTEGRTAERRTAEKRTAERRTTEGRTAERRTAEKRTAERRTTEGRTAERRMPATSRVAAAAAPLTRPSSTCSQVQQQPQGAESTLSREREASAGLRASSELVASVQSLVSVLQQQMEAGSSPPAPGLTQQGPQSRGEELRGQLALKEMEEAAKELHSLRQHNYLLQSKLQRAEEAGQQQRVKAEDAATQEQLQQMDREIKQQETLIRGYQQENEKLYSQMKAQQAKSKANQEAMFSENQRLLGELALTREQLKKSQRPVGSGGLLDHTGRMADLLAQVQALQRMESELSEQVDGLTVEKRVLEVDLQLVKRERDLAMMQATFTPGDRSLEISALEEKHREEVTSLKKKLSWFAENQELLDRDAGRLKAKTAEIQQLKEQVEKLQHEVGRRSGEQQRRSAVPSVDTKKMQELQRQVKELEHILRSRNPNSLPALIYAAASEPVTDGITALLERRIQRLEAELESHDEEAKRSLRAMEQHFHRIKLRYEQELSEMEQKLQMEVQRNAKAQEEEEEAEMEEEAQPAKSSHHHKERQLQQQIESLQQQLKHKAPPSPSRHQRQAEAAFSVRIERLNQELSAKTRTIQELHRTVERLQRERKTMLCVSNPPGPRKASSPPAEGQDTFPEAQDHKTYQPIVFTGSHISEVLQENEALKERVEKQEVQAEQQREAWRVEAEQAQEELNRLKECFAEQITSIKAEHLRVLDHLRATHALEHSSSKVAELANKLSTQEVAMKHVQEQLRAVHGVQEALAVSRTREEALQKQVSRLLQELQEATEACSPQVKLLWSLERKVASMEFRQQHRHQELQQVIGGAWQTAEANQQSEAEHWKHVAQDKSRQVEAFRVELDSILDILRHLQRQGRVLPPAEPLTQNT